MASICSAGPLSRVADEEMVRSVRKHTISFVVNSVKNVQRANVINLLYRTVDLTQHIATSA